MKRRLVESNARRLAAIEAGEQIVVGVNKFTEAEPSPLATGEESIITVDPRAEQQQIAALQAWRASRDAAQVKAALAELAAAAERRPQHHGAVDRLRARRRHHRRVVGHAARDLRRVPRADRRRPGGGRGRPRRAEDGARARSRR